MLINKLVESLDTPDIIKERELPLPSGMQSVPTTESLSSKMMQTKEVTKSHGVYAERYARMATGTSMTEAEPAVPTSKALPSFQPKQ